MVNCQLFIVNCLNLVAVDNEQLTIDNLENDEKSKKFYRAD